MTEYQEIEKILKEIEETFLFVHKLIDEPKLDLNDQYKRINYAYFKMFCCHLEALSILVKNNYFSSAILLTRTMLELFVKSCYLEFIEKAKGSNVIDFIDEKKDFPNFFKMTEALENFEHESYGGFKEVFKQFTKSGLASYEKFSLFSHGRGEFLKAFYTYARISYKTEQISDVLLTAKGLFEMLSLLLFFTQNKIPETGLLQKKINQA